MLTSIMMSDGRVKMLPSIVCFFFLNVDMKICITQECLNTFLMSLLREISHNLQ